MNLLQKCCSEIYLYKTHQERVQNIFLFESLTAWNISSVLHPKWRKFNINSSTRWTIRISTFYYCSKIIVNSIILLEFLSTVLRFLILFFLLMLNSWWILILSFSLWLLSVVLISRCLSLQSFRKSIEGTYEDIGVSKSSSSKVEIVVVVVVVVV